MAHSAQSNKILSPEQLSMLSKEELVTQLIKAHDTIQKLEAIIQRGKPVTDSEQSDTASRFPKPQAASTLAYKTSEESIDSSWQESFQDQTEVMQELKQKLIQFESGDSPKRFHQNEEFIVAYEYKGDFPSCDEDFSPSSLSEGEETTRGQIEIFIDKDMNRDDEDNDNNDDQLPEVFPLIPSPILNTPPYEYIFLTQKNEAKYRIFLNQKLNKVFQEEIHKLQVRDEQIRKGRSKLLFDEGNDSDSQHPPQQNVSDEGHAQEFSDDHTDMDIHNQNHLIIASSGNDIESPASTSNVIHCFDPSEVDLELKKIFLEKPPVTHKIVRRRSRRERGSSVPAVDSYYGTSDLHKVGHASYFIPTLTESERKAIGWKHEYHYGHWKYAKHHVPSLKRKQIPLHPHKESEIQAKQNHYYTGPGAHNPELDLSDPLVLKNDGDLTTTGALCKTCKNKHDHDQEDEINENEDTLSFITLSGVPDTSQSCHIIPDKNTLQRILKWLLPCVKLNPKLNTSATQATTENIACQDEQSSHHSKKSERNQKQSVTKHDHEIEMLVEPSRKLNFPASRTYFSFTSCDTMEDNVDDDEDEDDKADQGDHHHRGLFHWKKLLTYGTVADSMSVVGGDIIESLHDYKAANFGTDDESVTEGTVSLQSGTSYNGNQEERKLFDDSSSTESENDVDNSSKQSISRKKSFKKLKSCRAHTKLLTLKDLGYETDGGADNLGVNEDSNISWESLGNNGEEQNPTELISERNSKDSLYGDDVLNRNLSSSDISANDYPSTGTSEYPFSSLSISHQNSAIGGTGNSVMNTENPTPSSSLTEHQLDNIETRFLDPKDVLMQPRMKKPVDIGEQNEDSLPFIYGYNPQHDTDFKNESHEYDTVIEWAGEGFVDDIEEGLGLISSCLESLLKHDSAMQGIGIANHELIESEDIPEKVDGQHRITTLNDLLAQSDTENKNDSQ